MISRGRSSLRMVRKDLFLSRDDEIFILLLAWRLLGLRVEIGLHGRQERWTIILSCICNLFLFSRVVDHDYIVSYVLYSAMNYYLLVIIIIWGHTVAKWLLGLLSLLLLLRLPLLLRIVILLGMIHRIILILISLVVKRYLVILAPHL